MKQSGSRIRDSDEATSKANQFGKKQPPPKNDEDDEDNDSDNAGFRSGPSRLSSAGKVAGVAGVSAAAGGAAGAFAASSAAARKQPAAAFEDPGGFGKKKAPAPAKKKPVYEDSDEDISPMNSDLVRLSYNLCLIFAEPHMLSMCYPLILMSMPCTGGCPSKS